MFEKPIKVSEALQDIRKHPKKVVKFALVEEGAKARFHCAGLAAPAAKSEKVKNGATFFSGTVCFDGTKYQMVINGGKDELLRASKILKAAYMVDQKAAAAAKWDHLIFKANNKSPKEIEASLNDSSDDGFTGSDGSVAPVATTPPTSTAAQAQATAASQPTPGSQSTTQAATPASTAAKTPIEIVKFKEHAIRLRSRIDAVATFDASLLQRFKDAVQQTVKDPAKALRSMLELELDLVKAEQANAKLVEAATELASQLQAVAKFGLHNNSELQELHASALKGLQAKDSKKANRKLKRLKQKVVELSDVKSRMKLVSKWLYRQNWSDFTSDMSVEVTGPKAVASGKKKQDLIDKICKDLNISAQEAASIIQAALADLENEAQHLYPPGITPMYPKPIVNPMLSHKTRPKLNVDEIKALQDYAASGYENYNKPLREGKIPDGAAKKMHQDLQAAFAKAEPLETPLVVSRGLGFAAADKAKFDATVKTFQDGLSSGKLVPLLGYQSTGTNGIPPEFKDKSKKKYHVELTIIARLGLDVTPYACKPQEKELLLNHPTMLKVIAILFRHNGDTCEIKVEQILPIEKQG